MKEQLDSKLFHAFTQGENRGFKAVFDLYNREILYFTYKLTSNMPEAEDITSATFEKLFRLRNMFQTLRNIKAFLYITARNNSLDYLRSVKRKKTYAKDFSDINAYDEEYSIEEVVIQNELIETAILKNISDAVETLPDQCQRIFKMIFYEGKSVSAIAQELHITPETVRSQKRRALELLRIRLSDNQMELALIFFSSIYNLVFLH